MKQALLELPLRDFADVAKFQFSRTKQPSVLIFEGNIFHAEVLPGFVRYFNELGYHVDILTHQVVFAEKPFHGHDLRKRDFPLSLNGIRFVIKLAKMKEYEHALINTLRQCDGGLSPKQKCFESFFGMWPSVRKNVFCVAHDTREVDLHFPDPSDSWRDRVIMLGKFSVGHMVNSHYFGPVERRAKNAITRFVMIGTISPEIRNHQQLISTLCELKREGLAFDVYVIGRGNMEAIPSEIQQHVHIMGRLNFPDMYQQLREADFIIAGLDAENPDHDRYITTGVTGTAQLCYGFEIIPIIEEKFAGFYGFDSENAIVYHRAMAEAMREAIILSNEDYQHCSLALASLAARVRRESLGTLKKLLKTPRA